MKHYFTPFLLLFTIASYGQNEYAISLENEKIHDFEKREFYIESTIVKGEQQVFTYSKLNKGGVLTKIKYESGLGNEIKYLLLNSLPEKKDQVPLVLIIEKLMATEHYGVVENEIKITFQAKLVLDNVVLYTNRYEQVYSGDLHYEQYPAFIAETIQGYLYDFSMVVESEKPIDTPEDNYENEAISLGDLEGSASRNVVAIGYQIGGFSLIGVDYEFRATDNIGLHVGAGYRGFTAGVKIHWKPTKDGGFINVSYKDGGFGLINGWAVEYGSRKSFGENKGSFGFHYQIGLALITNISPEYRKTFGGVTPPFPSIALGLGFSW